MSPARVLFAFPNRLASWVVACLDRMTFPRFRLSLAEWLSVLAVGGLFLVFASDFVGSWYGERDGLRDANVDIEQGELKLKHAGFPPMRRARLVTLYKQRLGVELVSFGGCSPSPYHSAYNQSYNARVEQELRREDPFFELSAVETELLDIAYSIDIRRDYEDVIPDSPTDRK